MIQEVIEKNITARDLHDMSPDTRQAACGKVINMSLPFAAAYKWLYTRERLNLLHYKDEHFFTCDPYKEIFYNFLLVWYFLRYDKKFIYSETRLIES